MRICAKERVKEKLLLLLLFFIACQRKKTKGTQKYESNVASGNGSLLSVQFSLSLSLEILNLLMDCCGPILQKRICIKTLGIHISPQTFPNHVIVVSLLWTTSVVFFALLYHKQKDTMSYGLVIV